MTLLGMTFWEWAGTAVIVGLSGGVGLKLIGWLKEHLDRKARKFSSGAKRVLEQADRICGIAGAMRELIQDVPGSQQYRKQASVLWTTSSTPLLLNVWLANAWILRRKRKLIRLRDTFVLSVDQLRETATAWYKADMRWREATGKTEWGGWDGGDPKRDAIPEAVGWREATQAYLEAFERFLGRFQALHNALQPLVREYASQREGVTREEKQ